MKLMWYNVRIFLYAYSYKALYLEFNLASPLWGSRRSFFANYCDLTRLIQCHDIYYLLQDSFDISMLDDWNSAEESSAYVFSSSDGEDNDGEVFLTPVNDIDLPSVSASNDDAVTVATHRFATLGRGQKKPRWVCRNLCNWLIWIPFLANPNISYIENIFL